MATYRQCFYAKRCPLHHQCSDQAFKRSRCWDYELDKVYAKVADHLLKSGHHEIGSFAAAMAIAEKDTEIGSYDDKVDPAKSEKSEEGGGGTSSKRTFLEALLPRTTGPIQVKTEDEYVPVSVEALRRAKDAIERAAKSARHAESLCTQAARQFGNDAQALERNLAELKDEDVVRFR